MRKALLAGAVAVLLTGLGLSVPAQAVASQVSVTRLSGVPTSGIQYVIQVSVPNGLVGQKVWLERKVGTTWKPLKRAVLTSTKKVRLYGGLWLGSQKLRVHVFTKGNRAQALRAYTVNARPRLDPHTPSPYLNETATITAKLPTTHGRRVNLQRRATGAWVTVGGKNFTGNPRFTRAVTGPAQYRLVVPKKGKLAAIVSLPTEKIVPNERTRLVSRTPAGLAGNDDSDESSISADGRYVAFTSRATNLGPTDGNSHQDIYLRDLVTGTTDLVTRGLGGAPADLSSHSPEISGNGRYVAFESEASNLVSGDVNGSVRDIFRYDRVTKQIRLVTQDTTSSSSNGASFEPSISADGSRIAFHSFANDLVAVDDNGEVDVFLWSASSAPIARVSKPTSGATGGGGGYGASISGDGRWVGFSSTRDDLVAGSPTTPSDNAFLRDLTAGSTALVSTTACTAGTQRRSFVESVSDGGTYVLFSSGCQDIVIGDTNNDYDLFQRTMEVVGANSLVNHKLGGGFSSAGMYYGDVDMTSDGAYVVYAAYGSDLTPVDGNGSTLDVFRWTQYTGENQLVSRRRDSLEGFAANGANDLPGVSEDGRYVVWTTHATNVAAGDTTTLYDVVVRDLR